MSVSPPAAMEQGLPDERRAAGGSPRRRASLPRSEARRRSRRILLRLAVGWSAISAPLAGQTTPTTGPGGTSGAGEAVRSVELSLDSIEIGDRFDLRFALAVGPDEVAFFPDSLAAPGVEPFEAVSWEATPAPGGGTILAVRFPLLAYRTGSLSVPEVDLFVARSAEAVNAGLAQAGAPVGSWEDLRASPGSLSTARLLTVPEQRIQVASVLGLDDVTTQITPRPAADVSGGDRNWLSTLFLAAFGMLLAGVGVASARDWSRHRAMKPPEPPPTPREQALAALDELAASGMHEDGRVRELYSAWSEVVRRYVEGFSELWGPSWTSTELMSDLQGPRRGVAIERSMGPEGIVGVMRTAEEVKFGGKRPGAEDAMGHLCQAREWIHRSRTEPLDPDDGKGA